MFDLVEINIRIGPLAWFEADPVYGRSPLSVMFTDYSVGIISSRLWSFGDGATSTVANPVHVYTQPGDYLITLTVAGPDGVDVDTKLTHVSANEIYLPLVMRNH